MNSIGMKWGIIAGIGIAISSLLLYLVDAVTYFEYYAYPLVIICILCMVLSATEEKKLQNGFITFNELLNNTFSAFVIATLIYHIFVYALYHFVDPTLAETQKRMSLEAAPAFESIFNEEQMETFIRELKNRSFMPTIGQTFLTMAGSLIFPGIIIAAIISGIMKNNKPENQVV